MDKFDYPDLPARNVPGKLFDKRTTFLSVLGIALFSVLAALQVFRRPLLVSQKSTAVPVAPRSAPQTRQWTPALQRQVAEKLAAKGLKKQAAQAFDQYLRDSSVPLEQRAKVLYSAGKLRFDLADYEAALANFYQAEVAGLSGKLKEEVDRKVVACLERLGKSFDAQSELEQRTSLSGKKQADASRGLVVARIGKETITMQQVNEELQKLQAQRPEYVEKLRGDRSQLLEFVRQYIFQKLLARKARKMGLDEQPEFRKQMEDIVDQSLAQLLISRKIQEKVHLDPADLRNYFEANRQKYIQPAQARVSQILASSEEKAKKILAEAKSGKDFAELAKKNSEDTATAARGGQLKQPLVQGSDFVPGIGSSPDFARAVFATGPGAVCDQVVKSSQGFHVIRVNALEPGRMLTWDEAQKRVTFDYRMEKTQAEISKMIQDTLEVERVQILENVLLGQKGKVSVKPK